MDPIQIRQNSSVQVRVPVLRDSGYVEKITYKIDGAPPGLTYSFSPSFSEGGGNVDTVLTLNAALSTPLGGYKLVISAEPRAPKNKGILGPYVDGENYGGGGNGGSGIPIVILQALIIDSWEISLNASDGFSYTTAAV